MDVYEEEKNFLEINIDVMYITVDLKYVLKMKIVYIYIKIQTNWSMKLFTIIVSMYHQKQPHIDDESLDLGRYMIPHEEDNYRFGEQPSIHKNLHS